MRSVSSCVVDRDLLGVGQRVEHQPGADRLLGLRAGLGVELLAGLALRARNSANWSSSWSNGVHGVVQRATRPRPATTLSGSGTSVASTSASSTLSRACVTCSMRLTRPSRVRRSAVSSSRVSNSLASWANSSSASGSWRSLTAVTVTVTSASWSANSPATSVVVNVADSPADRPMMASSMPSIRPPWPTW